MEKLGLELKNYLPKLREEVAFLKSRQHKTPSIGSVAQPRQPENLSSSDGIEIILTKKSEAPTRKFQPQENVIYSESTQSSESVDDTTEENCNGTYEEESDN